MLGHRLHPLHVLPGGDASIRSQTPIRGAAPKGHHHAARHLRHLRLLVGQRNLAGFPTLERRHRSLSAGEESPLRLLPWHLPRHLTWHLAGLRPRGWHRIGAGATLRAAIRSFLFPVSPWDGGGSHEAALPVRRLGRSRGSGERHLRGCCGRSRRASHCWREVTHGIYRFRIGRKYGASSGTWPTKSMGNPRRRRIELAIALCGPWAAAWFDRSRTLRFRGTFGAYGRDPG